MKVAEVRSIGKDRKIAINPIIGELLGFEEGSLVYFYLIQCEYYHREDIKEAELLLIVSSIRPDTWSNLHDLEFRLGDEPGSFAKLAELLSGKGIGIQLGESRTILWNVRAELSVTVWFKTYEGTVSDLNKDIRDAIEKDPELRRYIKPVGIEGDTETWVKGEPSPLQRYTFKREFAPGIAKKPGKNTPIPIPDPQRFNTIMNGCLEIPQFVIERFNLNFELPSSNYCSVAGDGFAIVVADFDTKLLTLTLPRPGARIVILEFHAEDELGATAKMAGALSEDAINLLETKLNTLVFADHAIWQVIADLSGSPYRSYSAEELKEVLEKKLREQGPKLRTEEPVRVLGLLGGPLEGQWIDPEAFKMLRTLETEIRSFVKSSLEKAVGENWWQDRVPLDIRTKAEERMDKEERIYQWHVEEDEEPMVYVDFSGYVQIILRKNNWRELFKDTFEKEERIKTKLQELEPIRNKVFHSRRISREDLDRLRLYSTDILRAIRGRNAR